MLQHLLEEKNISIYQCAKLSGIPYTTLSEAIRGKTSVAKCSAETVYRLSCILGVTMEALTKSSLEQNQNKSI